MDYLTTPEVAKRWNISTKRITVLASSGRIPGAEFVAGRWLIPENAQKPADARVRASRIAPPQENSTAYPYHFPLVFFGIRSEKEAEQLLSSEEITVYRAFVALEQYNLKEARSLLEALLETNTNPYVNLGALGLLISVYIFLNEYEKANKTLLSFRVAMVTVPDHKEELRIMAQEINSELEGYDWFIKEFSLPSNMEFSPLFKPYAVLVSAFTEILSASGQNYPLNPSLYECTCHTLREQGYWYPELLMHIYLAIIHSTQNHREDTLFHLKKGLEIGAEHDCLFYYSRMTAGFGELADEALTDFPEEIRQKVSLMSREGILSFTNFLQYLGKSRFFRTLSYEDFDLIFCCIRKNTIREISEILGISTSLVVSRLTSLYQRTQVSGKKELCDLFINYMVGFHPVPAPNTDEAKGRKAKAD